MTLDDRAEELASDLGVDKAEVKQDLENLVAYSVPLDEAVLNVRRKYSDDTDPGEPETVDVGSVTTDHSNVTVTGVVLTAGKRSIRYQGDEQVIFEGRFADETGVIEYTAWQDFGLSAGDQVTVTNAGVREWNDSPELNLGANTTITESDVELSVPYEIGGERGVADVEIGDRGLTLDVRVIEVARQTIDGRDGETEILSGILGDETGRAPFTDWNPHEAIAEDVSLHVENAYAREFRGVPTIYFSEFTDVLPREDAVEVADEPTRLSIREAVAGGGRFDVELVGTVIEVRDGSGLIQRCPECNRVIQNGQCRSHGSVDGVDDLRTKAILDDGTSTVTAILDANATSEIYGGDLEDALAAARDAMDQEVVADAIRDVLVGREYAVRGQLSVDEYGANLTASEFGEVDDDPVVRAKALLAEVGE